MTDIHSPLRIGTKVLRNRITMAPTVKFYADEDGTVTDEFVRHYEERAAHECGLIVVEATCVAKEARLHPAQLGLWCDSQIDGHRKLADAVHRQGALVIPQIHHGGLGTHPDCGPLTSPSAVTWNDGFRDAEAVELTVKDIHRIEAQFTEAAIRAQKAGYDGVQLHACHAYLINDFASSVNRREDEYGQDKALFGSRIIRAIRQACGKDFLISARVSGCDPTAGEAVGIAEKYVAAGCDYLQVSCGIAEFRQLPHDESLPYNRIAALGVRMHEHFRGRVPVSCVNGFRTVEQVRYMFDHDLTDTIDLACGLLADPAFTEAILHGSPYVSCFSCPRCAFGPDHPHPCPAMVLRKADGIRF